jgi:membrane fusion protein (multidrug efflux system)
MRTRFANPLEGRISHKLPVLVLPALIFATACSEKEPPKPPPPPGVVVSSVAQKDVPIYQEWVGTMAGNIDADIRPKVDGFLLKQLYTEGSFVEKGQPLFQLDRRQADAAVDQAKGQVAQAKAAVGQAQIDINRYTPLVAEKAVSQAELDKAQSAEKAALAQQEASQAVLDNAKLNLGWTTVASPISGIAGIRKVSIGDLITPVTVMTTVSAVNPIYVDFSITEQDYLRFVRQKNERRAGQDLQLILGDGTVFNHRGRALLLNREVDSRTGTLQVRAEFPNPGNILRPGQYARIRAVTELRKDALVVPQRAVSELQGIYQVGVVGADNKVAIKAVKLGPQFGDMWVIDSGLAPGDKVIVDGLQRLRDGMVVAPTPFKDTQADAIAGGA